MLEKKPVSNTVAAVLRHAATQGIHGLGANVQAASDNHSAAHAPTSQPTPGKCAALARSMAGL